MEKEDLPQFAEWANKPVIMGLRKQFDDPRIFAWFEYLYDELKKREEQMASKTA